MSKELISDGNDFVVEWFDRAYGGNRRVIFRGNGADGSIFMGDITLSASGKVSIAAVPTVVGPVKLSTLNRVGGTVVPGNTINVYVDGLLGSDSNDGSAAVKGSGTVGPLQTVGAIYEKYASRPMNGCRIIVNCIGPASGAPTVYTERTLYIDGGEGLVNPFRFRGGTVVGGVFQAGMILAIPTGGAPATAALDVGPTTVLSLPNASGVSTPLRTQLNFATANPGWVVDDFAGGNAFLRVKRAGVMRYFEIPIARNTANTLIVDTLGIDGDLLATDTVEIVVPAVKFGGPAVADNNNVAVQSVIGNSGGQLSNGPTFGKDGGSMFERIGWVANMIARGSLALSFDRCALPSGGSIYSVDNITWVNCGMAQGSFNIIITRFSRFPGQSRPDSVSVPTMQAVNSPMVTLAGWKTTLQFGINGNTTGANGEPIELGSGNMVFAYPVGMWQSRPRQAAETRLGSLLSVGGPAGLVAFNNGVALMGDTDTTFVTAATLPAVRARIGAQIKIDPAVTSISGKGGVDLQLETGAAIAMGTGAGQFMEAAGYNGNFTRINDGTAAAPTGDHSRIFTSFPA